VSQWNVWKHDCIKHGMGTLPDGSVEPCKPRCEDPWQVDGPPGIEGGTFRTWAEAQSWATTQHLARPYPHVGTIDAELIDDLDTHGTQARQAVEQ
jgi:hypothetical protein